MKFKQTLRRLVTPHGGYFGHGIADPQNAPQISPDRVTHVHPADFERFLQVSQPTDVITFDDGYADNLTTALPLLERYNRSATVFVTTGFIKRQHPSLARVAACVARSGDWHKPSVSRLIDSAGDAVAAYDQLHYQLKCQGSQALAATLTRIVEDYGLSTQALTDDYLSIEQLRQLDQHPLIQIGAHTASHPDLRSCSNQELNTELLGARREIEDWLGHPIDTLAYPFGNTCTRVRQTTAAAGYRRAYITEAYNWRTYIPYYSRLDIPRIDLSGEARRIHRRIRKGKLNPAYDADSNG